MTMILTTLTTTLTIYAHKNDADSNDTANDADNDVNANNDDANGNDADENAYNDNADNSNADQDASLAYWPCSFHLHVHFSFLA